MRRKLEGPGSDDAADCPRIRSWAAPTACARKQMRMLTESIVRYAAQVLSASMETPRRLIGADALAPQLGGVSQHRQRPPSARRAMPIRGHRAQRPATRSLSPPSRPAAPTAASLAEEGRAACQAGEGARRCGSTIRNWCRPTPPNSGAAALPASTQFLCALRTQPEKLSTR